MLLCSKQNQLWMEGAELYKGHPYNKAPPYEYGIYSIKQRELRSSNGNSLQNVSKGKNLQPNSFRIHILIITKINRNTQYLNLYVCGFLENANSQTAKLRDRVQNISQKVDTMKLNDSHGTAKSVPATISNREFVHRDENKNTTTLSSVGGISTRRKVTPTAADIDNNNDNHADKSATNPTQGDTLNQIKAMRRRHTRLATNVSPVTGLYVFHSVSTLNLFSLYI